MPQGQDEQITVQQRDPQPVLSARTTVPIARLAAAQGEALRALWNHLRQQGARPIGPPSFVTIASGTPRPTSRSVSRWLRVPPARARSPRANCPAGRSSAPGTLARTMGWRTPTPGCRPGCKRTVTGREASAGRSITGSISAGSPTLPPGRSPQAGAPSLSSRSTELPDACPGHRPPTPSWPRSSSTCHPTRSTSCSPAPFTRHAPVVGWRSSLVVAVFDHVDHLAAPPFPSHAAPRLAGVRRDARM
jgi:hypothetical protein